MYRESGCSDLAQKAYVKGKGLKPTYFLTDQLLKDGDLKERFSKYPCFKHVILSRGKTGDPHREEQILKLSADQIPTPIDRLRLADFEHIDQLRNGRAAEIKFGGESHRFALESLFSLTTGEFLPTLCFFPGAKADNALKYKGEQKLDGSYRIEITTQLPSVVNAILPDKYGFAVVNESGIVLFHSDGRRNLRENLFGESSPSSHLRDVVARKNEDCMDLRYGGRRIRAYVTQLAGGDIRESKKRTAHRIPSTH